MRRISARTIIAAPWIGSIVMVVVAARAGWGLAVLAFLAATALALITANALAHALRTFKSELRLHKPTPSRADHLRELHDLRTSIITLSDEYGSRVAQAGSTEEQLLGVIESLTDGIIQISATKRLLHVNAAAREMLNLPRDAAGQSVATLIRNPDLRVCFERSATGASFDPIELTFDERHLLVSPRPFRLTGPAGAASGAVIAVVDLTELRRLESVRRDFVANVSHEQKTPLTSIRGYTETLLSDELNVETQRQFLEVVHKNAERIQRIVDDLLDLSRLQSGGWQPELQEVDPAVLAEDVWATCSEALKKQIQFSVRADPARMVLADPGGLRQILSNLFDNAIRYTPGGGQVNVVINGREDFVNVEVKDNGSGIPRESLPRIFERFYRVDAARSRGEGGTGLGLSIVKHLAESMSGDVSAESELGRGTTIRIRLPAAPQL
ncbi:MAG TPA: ATP-binding protein [Longimicrobiales bacterium]